MEENLRDTMDFTGFIFGNVDEKGNLEGDSVLNKEELVQLSRLGVVQGLGEVVGEDSEEKDAEESVALSDKLATAEDFADITELADEGKEEKERLYQKGMMYVQAQTASSAAAGDDDYDDDYDEGYDTQSQNTGSSLTSESSQPPLYVPSTSTCPPATAPSSSPVNESMNRFEAQSAVSSLSTATTEQPVPAQPFMPHMAPFMPPSLPRVHTLPPEPLPVDEGMEEPTAFLPEGFTSFAELQMKVKALFPDFKPDCNLRFLSMLGPGRKSSYPKIWQGARKRRKLSTDDSNKKRKGELTFDFGPDPTPDMCASDDEDKFLTPVDGLGLQGERKDARTEIDKRVSEWRNGPAKVWYDAINVPENGRGFDYGFKMKPHSSLSEDEGKPPSPLESLVIIPDDAFLMVTQRNWENDILWDVPHSTGPPVTAHGGVWTTVDGSAAVRHGAAGISSGGGAVLNIPVDNHELVYGRWEDDIIWDSERVSHIPRPLVVRLDPNDPNIVVGIPDEPVITAEVGKEGKKDGKKPTNKLWMNKLGKKDGNTQLLSFIKKDPFNLSNDEYYNPNHTSSTQGLPGFDQSNIVQHSTPALDLHMPWFPTHLSTFALRHFHRPALKIKTNGNDTTGWVTISSLVKQINKKKKEREKERVLSGGGEVFFMRSPEDLSATDSHIVLLEYCEEHPPLIMATGMSSKIKNYYRRPERQVKGGAPNFSYGETTYIQNTPYFLGSLQPGQSLQSLENNLFRAPIYPHSISPTDFLLIRSDNKYHVREISDVFVIGQECPKVEVPAPNSKIANQFQKELLQVFLYRLFQESDDNPKKLKMELVRRAFPPSVMSESVVRKVLKLYADFRREGYDSGSWVLKPDCRLPTDEELRALVTPEQACAYYSMSAAEQRLKDAGYGGKSLFSVDDEEEEDSTQKIDDEIRAAPWNTTHHFINAMKDKYQLSVRGPADPTGCSEGFSYTRLDPKEAASHLGGSPGKKPKSVMGTDADLRKLKLNKARSVLRNFGVPEEEIGKLSRWQVIDMVRTISTEAAKSGGDVSSLMFARGARSSHVEVQERYREDCQRVFDLQNKVLSSTEVLSTDEESSDSGGESDDELGRNLESLLSSKKTAMELSHEQEEIERQELRRLLLEDQPIGKSSDDLSERDRATPSGDGDDTSSVRSFSSITGRHLVISRTFRDEEGREYVRHEVVKNQAVIDAYVHIVGGSKDKDVRKQFAEKDEQTREDMKKEVKRLQHQLRQLDKMEERAKHKVHKTKKEKFSAMHVTCSACGQRGHMKTNKNCPKYKYTPVQVAPTDQELAQQESSLSAQDDLVKVEGTKVLLNKALLEHANDVRRKSLLLRFPKDKVRKRRRQGDEELDYLEKRTKAGKRRRTNPQVPFTLRLEKVINILTAMPEAYAFCKPVLAKTVPDYHRLIKFPMDLQTMKENNRKHRYSTRDQFWEHVNLVANNCITYNGFNSELTRNAQKMLEKCTEEMNKHTKELELLEKEINPLLGDKPQPALSYLLKKTVERMKEVPESWPFHYPVSAKKLPDYHMIITRPMDLDTMKKHCERHHYLSREEFLVDLEQIVENSITYNGPNSQFTNTAQKMKTAAMEFLEQQAEILAALESQLPPRDRSISRSPFNEGGSSSLDSSRATCLSLSGGRDAITVESEFGGEVGEEVDVEGLDEELMEEEDGVDLHSALLEDLQHSSSSSDSDSEGSDADD